MGKKQSNPLIRAANAQRSRGNPSFRVQGAVGSDQTVLKYNAVGDNIATGGGGEAHYVRWYIPGSPLALLGSAGNDVASYYSTGVFRPGTTAKWVPYVGYQTSGRVLVTYTDNPEIMASAVAWTDSQRLAFIRSSSRGVNFPIYEEKVIAVPTMTRRKRFDVNNSVDASNVDVLDRSSQVMMICAIVAGPASTLVGQWEFHDVLDVEGLSTANT